ncbi:MAG: hypothetical protein ACLP01_08675 [Solirubrobacteraceae bacterium]
MSEHEAARTLVKSVPELWMACSEESSLARHLRPFGEIRITRLEPETAVAWEGDRACGTVRLEPSGWGTRVTLTARAVDPPAVVLLDADGPATVHEDDAREDDVDAPAAPHDEETESAVQPETTGAHAESQPEHAPMKEPPHAGFWKKLFARRQRADAPAMIAPPEPEAVPAPSEPAAVLAPPEPAVIAPPEPVAILAPEEPVEPDPVKVLNEALDSLGRAHHRPFSRA